MIYVDEVVYNLMMKQTQKNRQTMLPGLEQNVTGKKIKKIASGL